ncbi:siderophore-interacting protein [Leucobacter sp. GX24907]
MSPFILARVAVIETVRLSPAFTRIIFGGRDLAEVGIGADGRDPVYDQRIKLVFPAASGELPPLERDARDWYADWKALPDDVRGAMRTYSIRDLVGQGNGTRVVVDFVLHSESGVSGPASAWAATAQPGDEVYLLAPRAGHRGGGIEFAPPGLSDAGPELLLVGDETAAPAITRILLDLPTHARGRAFIEVPQHEDILEIGASCGVEVSWLARAGAAHGTRLIPAVLDALGGGAGVLGRDEVADPDEPMLWETPGATSDTAELVGRYAWIAGESGVVTTLRRQLVGELGFDRSEVAFMGYWRRGVAMRS